MILKFWGYVPLLMLWLGNDIFVTLLKCGTYSIFQARK